MIKTSQSFRLLDKSQIYDVNISDYQTHPNPPAHSYIIRNSKTFESGANYRRKNKNNKIKTKIP
jgi:hypothetical protein